MSAFDFNVSAAIEIISDVPNKQWHVIFPTHSVAYLGGSRSLRWSFPPILSPTWVVLGHCGGPSHAFCYKRDWVGVVKVDWDVCFMYIKYVTLWSTQPSHPSVGRCNKYQRKLWSIEKHYATHQPHIHGLAAKAKRVSGWRLW